MKKVPFSWWRTWGSEGLSQVFKVSLWVGGRTWIWILLSLTPEHESLTLHSTASSTSDPQPQSCKGSWEDTWWADAYVSVWPKFRACNSPKGNVNGLMLNTEQNLRSKKWLSKDLNNKALTMSSPATLLLPLQLQALSSPLHTHITCLVCSFLYFFFSLSTLFHISV